MSQKICIETSQIEFVAAIYLKDLLCSEMRNKTFRDKRGLEKEKNINNSAQERNVIGMVIVIE